MLVWIRGFGEVQWQILNALFNRATAKGDRRVFPVLAIERTDRATVIISAMDDINPNNTTEPIGIELYPWKPGFSMRA